MRPKVLNEGKDTKQSVLTGFIHLLELFALFFVLLPSSISRQFYSKCKCGTVRLACGIVEAKRMKGP